MVDVAGAVSDACGACHDKYREKKGGERIDVCHSSSNGMCCAAAAAAACSSKPAAPAVSPAR